MSLFVVDIWVFMQKYSNIYYKGGRIMKKGSIKASFGINIEGIEQSILLEFNEEDIENSLIEEIEEERKQLATAARKLVEIAKQELEYIIKRKIIIEPVEPGKKYRKIKITGGYLPQLDSADFIFERSDGTVIVIIAYGSRGQYKYSNGASKSVIEFFSAL